MSAIADQLAETSVHDGVKKPIRRPRWRRPKKPQPDPVIDGVVVAQSADLTDLEPKKEKSVACRYFQSSGKCKFGENCRYLHVLKDADEPAEKDVKKKKVVVETDNAEQFVHVPDGQVIQPPDSQSRKRFAATKPVKIVLKCDQIGSAEQSKARSADVNYLKRRFAGTKVEDVGEKTRVTFMYMVSDPEWVFDVKSITLTMVLEKEHPISLAQVENVEQGMMPEALQKHLKSKLNEILRTKYNDSVNDNVFEPIGKWFVRQMDRNILNIFIVGLKKAQWLQNAEACGIKITVFDKPAIEGERKLTTIEQIREKESQEIDENGASQNSDEEMPSSSQIEVSGDEKNAQSTSTDPQPSFAPLKLHIHAAWEDQLQTIGTITFTHISGAARCIRCQTQEFFDVSAGKTQSWLCKKCSTKQSIRFDSLLAHQNSAIFGECFPVGCRPRDLILQSSKVQLSCLGCSKDVVVEALPYGSPYMTWCRQCNSKLKFVINWCSFKGNVNAIPSGELVKGAKGPKKKTIKDEFVISQGQPLPKTGTCKHYGKSFRWFRFPCCGKLYPCDVCHADVEKDHEMKLANRMICGFCSTEQPYSTENCKFCKSAIVKSRSAFWEGGKGCRDQKKMSKNDVRKYKNTSAKTVPKKRTGQIGNKE